MLCPEGATAAAAPSPAPAPKSIFARKRQVKASEASAETDFSTDVGDWLADVGAPECESAFRENMVETVGDVMFLVNSRSDLTAMCLSSAQAGRLWDHVAALSSSSGSSGSVDAGQPLVDPDEDVSTWLLSNGASDCEEAMREAMVETVGDMLFLVNSKSGLADMGLSNLQVETIWGALKGTQTGRSLRTAASADDDLDVDSQFHPTSIADAPGAFGGGATSGHRAAGSSSVADIWGQASSPGFGSLGNDVDSQFQGQAGASAVFGGDVGFGHTHHNSHTHSSPEYPDAGASSAFGGGGGVPAGAGGGAGAWSRGGGVAELRAALMSRKSIGVEMTPRSSR